MSPLDAVKAYYDSFVSPQFSTSHHNADLSSFLKEKANSSFQDYDKTLANVTTKLRILHTTGK